MVLAQGLRIAIAWADRGEILRQHWPADTLLACVNARLT